MTKSASTYGKILNKLGVERIFLSTEKNTYNMSKTDTFDSEKQKLFL